MRNILRGRRGFGLWGARILMLSTLSFVAGMWAPVTQLRTATAATTATASGCGGDCNGDGEVTIDELIKGVNIALGNASLSACPNFDLNGDGEVTIDELIKAVNAALNGCPEVPTATPTLVPTGTPAPTNTVVPTNTPIPTRTFTLVPDPTPSNTLTPTRTPTAIPTVTFTVVPDPTPSATATHTPTASLSVTAANTPTNTRTNTPTTPTPTPTSEIVRACDDFDECTVQDTCQADGTCKGTPKEDGTPCDDSNSCTANDQCQAGHCAGTQVQDGTACTSPLGACMPNPTCTSGFCFGDLVQCPQGDDQCTVNFCDPSTGQCTSFTNTCVDQCSTGQCDPATGECINVQPTNEGQSCDDGNVCTTNDHCQAGTCKGAALLLPTATPTSTGLASPTGNVLHTATATATSPTTPLEGTPTPSATSSPGTGGASVPRRAGAAIESTTNALLVIPNLLSVALGHNPGSLGQLASTEGPLIQIFDLPFSCPASGGGSVSCSQDFIGFPPSLGPPTFAVTLSACVVNTASGGTITFSGTLTAIGQQGDSCGSIPTNPSVTISTLTVTTAGTAGSTVATFTNVTGTLALSCSADTCTCSYDTINLNLTGSIGVQSKDTTGTTQSSTQVAFSNSSITISVQQYDDQCVPVIYAMSVDGDAMLSTDGNSFDASFSGYTLNDDATSGVDLVSISGDVTSACFGATVSFNTVSPLALSTGSPCPQAGSVEVSAGGVTDLVSYTAGGGVAIDLGDNGSVDETYLTCLDPQLAVCPA